MSRRLDPDRLHAGLDAFSRRYVDAERLPFTITQVTQHGEVVARHSHGFHDHERTRPIAADAIVRLWSMTKPLASVALLQLVERGEALLANPIRRWLPELADLRVWAGGNAPLTETVALERPPHLQDLLTHTAGFTNGFMYLNDLDAAYRERNLGNLMGGRPDYDLAGLVERLVGLPLLHQPGAQWSYSLATDLVARIVEVISGQRFDDYVRDHVTGPLGMADTDFWVRDEADADRLTPMWVRDKGKRLSVIDRGGPGSTRTHEPSLLSGSGGLVGTLDDYQRFADALLGGGAAHGARLLGTRTVELMGMNHLPGGSTIDRVGQGGFSESVDEGRGFGLGLATVVDAAASGEPSEVGELTWGGAASTNFWVDPVNQITCVFLTQLLPSRTYPLPSQLRWAVYQALVED